MTKRKSGISLAEFNKLSRKEKTFLLAIMGIIWIVNIAFCYFSGLIAHGRIPH